MLHKNPPSFYRPFFALVAALLFGIATTVAYTADGTVISMPGNRTEWDTFDWKDGIKPGGAGSTASFDYGLTSGAGATLQFGTRNSTTAGKHITLGVLENYTYANSTGNSAIYIEVNPASSMTFDSGIAGVAAMIRNMSNSKLPPGLAASTNFGFGIVGLVGNPGSVYLNSDLQLYSDNDGTWGVYLRRLRLSAGTAGLKTLTIEQGHADFLDLIVDDGAGQVSIVKSGTGILTATGMVNNSTGGLFINEGTLIINGTSALGAISAAVTLGDATLRFDGATTNIAHNFILTGTEGVLNAYYNGANTITLSGEISGTGNLLIRGRRANGENQFTFTGANSFTGTLGVALATMNIDGEHSADTIGGVVMGQNAIVNNNSVISGTVWMTGTHTTANTGRLNNNGIITGDVIMNNGGVVAGSRILLNAGAINGNVFVQGTSQIMTTSGTIGGDVVLDALSVSATIANTGRIGGDMIIDGLNSRVLNNGSIDGSVALSGTGSIFAGAGPIGGNMIITGSNATLVGIAGQTMTIGGNLVMNESTHLAVTLGPPNIVPLFQINGNLTLDGLLDLTGTAGFGAGLYKIFDYEGTLTDNTLEIGHVPDDLALMGIASIYNDSNEKSVNLLFSVGRIIWNGGAGGDGVWTSAATATSWTKPDGSDAGAWEENFAIFRGAPGRVTVDNSDGPVAFTGAQFAADGFVVSGGTLTLNNPDGAIRVGNGSAEGAAWTARIESAITGTGGFQKTDLGTLVLAGDNAYTGPTTVAYGALLLDNSNLSATTVAAGARLGGRGHIRGDLVNHGTIHRENSIDTLKVAGNYTQTTSGTLVIELASLHSFDKIEASGSANLAGGLKVVALPGFTFASGDTYQIITAPGGVSGTFATLDAPWGLVAPRVRFELLYQPNSVLLSFTQLTYTNLQGTLNEHLLSAAVDGAIDRGTIPNIQSALNALPDDNAVRDALGGLSPQGYQRLFEQSHYTAGATVRIAESQLSLPSPANEASLWTQYIHRESTLADDADLGKADAYANGVVIGVNNLFKSKIKVGALFSYTREEIDYDRSGDSWSEGNRYIGSLYGRYDYRSIFCEAVGGIGYTEFKNRRDVSIPNYERTAVSSTSGRDYFASMRIGWHLRDRRLEVTPYLGVQYFYWETDGFQETGADEANLKVYDQSAESLGARAGLALAYPIRISGSKMLFTPWMDIALGREYIDTRRRTKAELGGHAFAVRAQPVDAGRNMSASVGLNATLSSHISAYVRLAGDWSPYVSEALSIDAGLMIKF